MANPTSDKTLWRPAEITARRGIDIDLAPDAEARAALAADLGILALPEARLHGRLSPEGRADIRLEARLDAVAVQACVVTLDPVRTRIGETVLRRYLAEMPPPSGDETEMPEDDTAEPLGARIDLGEVLREALALALPPYPRSAAAPAGDAAFGPDGAGPAAEERVKPFAGLADLLGRPPGDGDEG